MPDAAAGVWTQIRGNLVLYKENRMQAKEPSVSLLKDSEWSKIDGEACRVIDFSPMATIKDGEVLDIDKRLPYASVILECKRYPGNATGFITHKEDFAHLWAAFIERKVNADEEVIIFWTKKHYRKGVKLFSAFMPKLWVLICPKGAYNFMVDDNYRPEISGEARAHAQSAILDWKPEVME